MKILFSTFLPHFFLLRYGMSKLEFFNKLIKNTKLDTATLELLCKCFIDDLTASQTAEKLNISRQTVNNYYKSLRLYLINEYNMVNNILLNIDKLHRDCINIKYISFAQETIYYIDLEDKLFLIENGNEQLKELSKFIDLNLGKTLKNHKRANCARVIYNFYDKQYFTTSYLKSKNELDEYINKRLKKFRGINKDNLMLHIKESIIRFNFDKKYLQNSLFSLFINSNRKY